MPLDGRLFLLSLITFFAGLLFLTGGLVFFFLARRRGRATARQIRLAPREPSSLVKPASPPNQPAPPSPLTRIRFRQAFQGDGLSEAVLDFARESLNLRLLGQGANVVIRSIEAGKRIGGMNVVLRFSRGGMQMLQDGELSIPVHTAAGRLLPEIDRGGRLATLAGGGVDVAGALANASALMVSVAYVLVSRDTLRRLRKIEGKLDELLADRRSERLSRLERIYVKGGEAFRALPYGAPSPRLEDFQSELYELRAGWRREVERILGIAPGTAGRGHWTDRLRRLLRGLPILGGLIGWSELRARTAREQLLFEHLLPIVDVVRCLRLALLVDVCIAQWTESVDVLFEHTLQSEAEMWEGIADRLEAYAQQFQSARGPEYRAVIGPAVEAIRAYTDALNGNIPRESLLSTRGEKPSRRGRRAAAAR